MPEQNSAGRNLFAQASPVSRSSIPESIVIRWVEFGDPPPVALREAVQKYRWLTALVEHQEDTGKDTSITAQRMDRLYDSLVESATDYLAHRAAEHGVSPEKQLRRLRRREMARMTWLQLCDLAIQEWREARRNAHV